LALAAVAFDEASFVCETEPPFPGLSTRMETLVFDGFSCSVAEIAAASCSLSAACPTTWLPPSPQQGLPACV
jgi:hypothetical protein